MSAVDEVSLNTWVDSRRFWDEREQPLENLDLIHDCQNFPLLPLRETIISLQTFCPNIEDHIDYALAHCQQPKDGLTKDESTAIYVYTMHWHPKKTRIYYGLNKALRSQSSRKLQIWLPFFKLLITGLQKLPSQNRIIWRGISLDVSEEYQVGTIITWWSFSSCTASLEILESNQFLGQSGSRTLFSIECQNGKRVRAHSQYYAEDEFILLPGTQLKVKGKLKLDTDLHVIQLREIGAAFPGLNYDETYRCKTDSIRVPSSRRKAQATNDDHNERLLTMIERCPMNGIANLVKQELTDKDMPLIMNQLICEKQPSNLQLCSNKVGEIGAQQLGQALQSNGSICQLNMRDNQILDLGAHYIASALCVNTTLISLNLVNNHISNEGFTAVARALYINTTLNKVYLGKNYPGPDSIQRLAQALCHNKSLQVLDLSSNGIGDDQLIYLAAMLKRNNTLMILGLANNPITNVGIRFPMYALRTNQGLQGLDIATSQLSYGCIKYIQKMFQYNQTLTQLFLSMNSFSTVGRLKLWSINHSLNGRRICFAERRNRET